MAKQPSKVASWYWITSAILTPFVLLATVLWAYFAMQSQAYRDEARRIARQVEADAADFEPMVAHMKRLAEITGFAAGDPLKDVNSDVVKGQLGKVPSPIAEQEPQKPYEDRNPIYNIMRDTENAFYGQGDQPGHVQKYIAARVYLGEFEKKVQRYLNFKATQHYTVRTIDIGGKTAIAASGDLSRKIQIADGTYVVPEADIDAANSDPNREPADQTMRKPARITMELVLRRQAQLVSDLITADQHQYSLLYAEVTGSVGGVPVGFQGEEARKAQALRDISGLNGLVDGRRAVSEQRLEGALGADELALTETKAKKLNYELATQGLESNIATLAGQFETERLAHEADAEEYKKMTRLLPRIKTPIKIEKREADGEITYSDYGRRVVHINLGRDDGVRAGQRFEVWRLHGRNQDAVVGVIEIVRCLSAHYSLCTVLSLVDDNDPVRKNDKIISRIWHRGKFLTIALHGTFEPPNQAYTVQRLTELLKQQGCTIVEKVQPGTDIVITGSNLLGDEWYRKARDDIRFETLKEEDVRVYIDPR
ncbi:MAG: hypothetical protein HS108_13115 [Planctomycetes bacterium]|nr:hypothetical protein [Planctomycetota bacterium]